MARPLTPSRGDLWLAYLDPVVGHEQGGTRPVLVISSQQFNSLHRNLVVVVPLTSTPPRIELHVAVPAGVGGLETDSAILCDQVRAISRRRLKRWRGTLDPGTMAEVDDVLRTVFGLYT